MATRSQTQNMIRAGQAGHAASGRAHEQLMAQERWGLEQAQRSGVAAGQAVERAEGRLQQQEQFEASQKQQQKQFQSRQDLEAAKSGLMANPRAQALEQEMARGNQQLAEQGDKPVEMPGAERAFIASPEGEKQQALAEREMGIRESREITNRINSATRVRELQSKVRTAKTKEMKAENEAALKQNLEGMQSGLKSSQNLIDKLGNGVLSESDLQNLRNDKKLRDNPNPALQQELESGIPGPALMGLMRRRQDVQVMNYIMDSNGRMPDGDYIDPASPMMQFFTQEAQKVNGFLKQVDAVTQGFMPLALNITTAAIRNNTVRTLAAQSALQEFSREQARQQAVIAAQGQQVRGMGAQAGGASIGVGEPDVGPQPEPDPRFFRQGPGQRWEHADGAPTPIDRRPR